MAGPRIKGIVKSFSVYGGNGTILLPDGTELPVHYAAIRGQGVRQLQAGTPVSLEVEQTRRGARAVCVQPE